MPYIKMNFTGKIYSDSSGGLAVRADSSLTASIDPDNRSGWLFEKSVANTNKFNLYYWGQGNRPKTPAHIRSLKAIVSIDNYQSVQSLPFFVVYTKPKGDGSDDQPWYNAKRAFTLTTSEDIEVGQKIEMYAKHVPKDKGVRQVQFNNTVDSGTFNESDEILYITIQSDSAAPANTKILIEALGIDFRVDGNNNDIYLELTSVMPSP